MKNLNIKTFVLASIFTCVGGASMAQSKEAKEAIDYAEKFDFSVGSIDNYCYIALDKGVYISRIDDIARSRKDINNANPIIIASGIHNFVFSFNFEGRDYVGNLGINVENDKCYRIGVTDITKTSCRAFIEALADTETLVQGQDSIATHKDNLEEQKKKLKEFLAFQEANPNHLDGIWKGEKKRAMNTFFMQYTIDGDKIMFEGKSKHAGMKPFVAEGTMFYSENIIIFFPEKAYNKSVEVENFSKQPKYVWYYTKTNDELILEGGRLFDNKGLIWENTGKLHKTE